ncbi:MAG: hypothetical protein WC314_14085 [Vulcanimicrobiota bacterium]
MIKGKDQSHQQNTGADRFPASTDRFTPSAELSSPGQEKSRLDTLLGGLNSAFS